MKRTGYLYDSRYLLHDTGPYHPERPERLEAIQHINEPPIRIGRVRGSQGVQHGVPVHNISSDVFKTLINHAKSIMHRTEAIVQVNHLVAYNIDQRS